MYFVDRSAVVLKPTEAFLKWLKATDADMPDLTLAQLRSNCTTLLVPEFDTPEAVMGYLGEHHRAILEAELASWEIESEHWPADMGVATLWSFFEVEIHDMVLDLETAELQVSPVSDNMM